MVLATGPHQVTQYNEIGLATLHIEHINSNLTGEYTCTATNDLGSTSTTARITVVTGGSIENMIAYKKCYGKPW